MASILFSNTFLVSLFILNLFIAHLKVNGDGSIGNIDCGGACKERCRLSLRQKMCLRDCGSCCKRCHCVPPGHYVNDWVCHCYDNRCHCPPDNYGNEDVCPCYTNMTTHHGSHKCP